MLIGYSVQGVWPPVHYYPNLIYIEFFNNLNLLLLEILDTRLHGNDKKILLERQNICMRIKKLDRYDKRIIWEWQNRRTGFPFSREWQVELEGNDKKSITGFPFSRE